MKDRNLEEKAENLLRKTIQKLEKREEKLFNFRIKMLEVSILTLTAELIIFNTKNTVQMNVAIYSMILTCVVVIASIFFENKGVTKSEFEKEMNQVSMSSNDRLIIAPIKFKQIDYIIMMLYIASIFFLVSIVDIPWL